MTGPDHHAEMEAHYAAGMERQEQKFAYDDALAEAKARLAEEIEREGWPPSAEILIAWGVGAGVRTASKPLLREIGDAREELSRLKCDASRQAEEARSWRAVAERLETEMQDLLHACDCEIRDMTHNRNDSDKRSAAYAEGALRVAKGIAHRIREKAAAR